MIDGSKGLKSGKRSFDCEKDNLIVTQMRGSFASGVPAVDQVAGLKGHLGSHVGLWKPRQAFAQRRQRKRPRKEGTLLPQCQRFAINTRGSHSYLKLMSHEFISMLINYVRTANDIAPSHTAPEACNIPKW